MVHRLIILLFIVLLSGTALFAQTVTEGDIIGLKKSNAPDELIIKAISIAKRIDVDTSFNNTVLLMSKGISQAVVDALVRRKAQLESQTTSLSVPTLPTNPPQSTGTYPQAAGSYFLSPSGWKKMEQAPMLEMSQNLTKVINPFGKSSMGQKLDGPEAPVKVGLQPEFCVIGNSEIPIRSLIVVKLTKRGKNRELTTMSSGVFRATKINEYDKLSNVLVERISDREITVKFDGEIKSGEYALMIGLGSVFDFSARPAGKENVKK
jgi:hypothetical protein